MQLRSLLWDEAHIASHRVESEEVENVVFGETAVFAVDDSHRVGRLVARGRTRAGRHLLVVLDEPTAAGDAYVVTARPMTERERQEYDELRRGASAAEGQA